MHRFSPPARHVVQIGPSVPVEYRIAWTWFELFSLLFHKIERVGLYPPQYENRKWFYSFYELLFTITCSPTRGPAETSYYGRWKSVLKIFIHIINWYGLKEKKCFHRVGSGGYRMEKQPNINSRPIRKCKSHNTKDQSVHSSDLYTSCTQHFLTDNERYSD